MVSGVPLHQSFQFDDESSVGVDANQAMLHLVNCTPAQRGGGGSNVTNTKQQRDEDKKTRHSIGDDTSIHAIAQCERSNQSSIYTNEQDLMENEHFVSFYPDPAEKYRTDNGGDKSSIGGTMFV
mmetsp:Transcript_19659/g.24074  ORF Transcript_19659/g.24074 Transcript_19659/m.24074 type:complete len:124 (-) Transcript_19659:6-377(-)